MAFLRTGERRHADPSDELQAIAVNYTSGTTGRPKGVVYTHRGAFLNALGLVDELRGPDRTACTCGPCRCSTAMAGAWSGASRRSVARMCACRGPEPTAVIEAMQRHGVTHSVRAPVVLSSIVAEVVPNGVVFEPPVRVAVGGAPPSPATIMKPSARAWRSSTSTE